MYDERGDDVMIAVYIYKVMFSRGKLVWFVGFRHIYEIL